MLHLIERLTSRISTIDDLGLLDSSVLGEIVHPRTFNTLRRIRDEDGAVLDEEEARAELAGPEVLLKQLKDMLNRGGSDSLSELPNGIHSGLRRDQCNGLFFYFQAPRSDGLGRRHFWRYIDAQTHEIKENRYEIAQTISCLPDEPRTIGDQDVFTLQDKVIEHILGAEREAEARAAAPMGVDPIQQTVTEEFKDAIRRRAVDREQAKRCITFLGQPMGKASTSSCERLSTFSPDERRHPTSRYRPGAFGTVRQRSPSRTEPEATPERRAGVDLLRVRHGIELRAKAAMAAPRSVRHVLR